MFQKFDIKTKNAFVALRLLLSDSTLYTLFAHAVLKLLKWHFHALHHIVLCEFHDYFHSFVSDKKKKKKNKKTKKKKKKKKKKNNVHTTLKLFVFRSMRRHNADTTLF